MNTIYIVNIEPLDNRYTKQWFTWIPILCEKHLHEKYNIINISGDINYYKKPQQGAFFDFAATCNYKAQQAQKISQLFKDKKIKDNDIFFFTDAWNQTIHTVKYISELNNIKIKIAGIWHAGAYDPTDILGTKIVNRTWVYNLERSYYDAIDINFFGTKQHLNKFIKNLNLPNKKCFVVGYPLEYISKLQNNNIKKDIVVFPHRLNFDKAPWIFDELEKEVHKTHPNISFIKTQEHNLNKKQYYDLLKKSKVIFSANKHENLGIGTFEAMSAGCLPIVPDKLSYVEMYDNIFRYECLNLYNNFDKYKNVLSKMIIEFIINYNKYNIYRQKNVKKIQDKFFNGIKMIKILGGKRK